MKLKIIRIGNSLGIILPKRILSDMSLAEGDHLFLSADGDPARLILGTSEAKLEGSGMNREERREVDRFLELYSHLFRAL